MKITADEIQHYRHHGYVIIENFLEPDELSLAQDEIRAYIPGWLEYAEGSASQKPDDWDQKPRSRRHTRFPFAGQQLNAITLHPELRRFAAIMMGHDDLFCEQSDLSYKCTGHYADVDQRMHLDYMNHTLVYPPADPSYWQTAYLIYYSDVDEDQGPTAVCSSQHYQDKILWPTGYTREQRAELYENEVKVTVPAGSLLAYGMRTFHRGTAFNKPSARVAQFISYAPANCPWLGIVGWPEQGVRPEFCTWIETATPAERELLGFPRPGHAYWTDETLAGVAARYPNMDLSPYRR